MNIGPFLFPPLVFATLIGVLVLMIITAILTRRVHSQFDQWLWIVLVCMGLSARFGFVMRHWESFSQEPWRIFYIWQGGFEPIWGLVAGVLSLVFLSTWRRRAMGLGTYGIALAAALAALAFTPQTPTKPLPDLSLMRLSGETVRLSDYANEKLVLNIWASWCGPCRREMPMLEQAEANYPGVHFLFINQGEQVTTVETYLRQESLSMHQSVLLDPRYAVAKEFDTLGTPTTLFFNKNHLVATHLGELSGERLKDYLRLMRP